MNEENKLDPIFKEKANTFLKELKDLQEKHNVVMRPVITTFGPDISIFDAKKEEEQKEEK